MSDVMETLWQRAAARLVPTGWSDDLCRVEFIKTEPPLTVEPRFTGITASGGFVAPVAYVDRFALDYDPMPGWNRWVTPVWQMLPTIRVQRGGITYPLPASLSERA